MARFRAKSARYGDIVGWVERNVRIPASDARPGAIRLTGYQPGMLAAYADADVEQVSMMLPSQSGKTLSVLMMMSFSIVNRPSTMMMVNPREDDSARFLDDKFAPLYESNPSVRAVVHRNWSRKAIGFDGGRVRFAHSGSAPSMASTTAFAVFADEVDKYSLGGLDADNPLDVLRQRMVTHGKAATFVALSTPTDKGASMIAAEYESGSRGEYLTSCQSCGSYQALGEANVADGVSDALACADCGVRIGERERLRMIAGGKWNHAEPRNPNRSFHMTQFSSPLVSLARTLSDRARSTKRGWTCQGLALPYEWDEGESFTADEAAALLVDGLPFVRGRRDGATVGVDVQGNRIEYTLIVWRMESGEHPRAHVVEHRAILYNADDGLDFDRAFGTLWERLRAWRPLDCVFVDAGYRTGDVWRVCKSAPRWLRGRLYPCQGHDDRRRAFAGDDFILRRNDSTRKGVWYLIDSHRAKSFAAEIVKSDWVTVDRAGVPNDWTAQFASERMMMVATGRGQARPAWVQVAARNEAWDCFVYALSARRQSEAAALANPKKAIV